MFSHALMGTVYSDQSGGKFAVFFEVSSSLFSLLSSWLESYLACLASVNAPHWYKVLADTFSYPSVFCFLVSITKPIVRISRSDGLVSSKPIGFVIIISAKLPELTREGKRP